MAPAPRWQPTRALIESALFVCALAGGHPAAAAPCPAPAGHGEEAVVEHLYDGDTLRLRDGRRLRLVGIDTPEIGRDGAPSEAFAEAALDALRALAGPGTRLTLTPAAEPADRYRRLLAHAHLRDGTSVQERLLEAGLATTLVVPPNVGNLACYAAAEARARAAHRGLWGLPRYQPRDAASLPRSTRGFSLVTGRVQRVGQSRANLWLNLAPDVAVRIPREDLRWFGDLDPARLAGRRLLVRGYVHLRNGELRLTVRHPAALAVLE